MIILETVYKLLIPLRQPSQDGQTALDVALAKRDEASFDKARETRSLAHAVKFANATKFGGWKPAPPPGDTQQPGSSLGRVFGGLGFK